MIFKKAIPRRAVLRGMGATLALPLLDGMVPAFAGPSDTAAKPVIRMGFMYVPNGIIMEKWTPAAEGAAFEMTPTLEPLAAFQDRLVVLTGLDQKPAEPLLGEIGAGHSRASAAYLTGAHPKSTEGADIHAGISVDQIAAKELGKKTQLASLEMALDPVEASGVCESGYSCAYRNTLCWSTPTTPLPMEDQPRQIFERLFGDNDTTDAAARLDRIQKNRSLLDALAGDVARFQKSLAPTDRAKLSEYLYAIRDIERRIQIAEEQTTREMPTLERPAGIPASFEEYARLMYDLLILAYQADLTRVSTFMIAHENSSRPYPQSGVTDGHHPLTHHRGDLVMIAKVALINRYHVKLFSYFLERLRSTPDGDGSLLDHSMIVYGAGMSDGNVHSNINLPVLLLGGGAAKINGGRHLRFPSGTPMTNLYMSMLDKAGIPIDSMGDSTGRLEVLSLA